jgi:hypothetical protein
MDPIDPRFVQVSFLHPAPAIHHEQQRMTRLYQDNLARCINFAMKHPRWRISLQQHKFLNIP